MRRYNSHTLTITDNAQPFQSAGVMTVQMFTPPWQSPDYIGSKPYKPIVAQWGIDGDKVTLTVKK